MSLRGASFLSLSFPLSFSSFFPSVSLSLVPTCSLKSCSPPVVFRQSKDKVEICWEQWTVRQCVCVHAWVCVCERERLMLSLWSCSPLVLTDRSLILLRLTPWCYITHSQTVWLLWTHITVRSMLLLCSRSLVFKDLLIYFIWYLWLVKVWL